MQSGKSVALIAGVMAVAIVGVLLLTRPAKDRPSAGTLFGPTGPVVRPPESSIIDAKDEIVLERGPAEVEVGELRYLPEAIELSGDALAGDAAMLHALGLREGNRRLGRVRQLTDPAIHGHFLAPRLSPDGLQVMLTRPGFDGVYVMPVAGGEPVLVAEENSFRARWTADGKIEVRDEEGMVRVYSPDGTLERTAPWDPTGERAYSQDDTIFARASDGAAAAPITGNNDRYFNPVPSPDGRYVAYQGLHSGIYVARADGSERPRFLGEGNHPVWAPDSGRLLYDITRDDGHALTTGDLYLVDLNASERSNLTRGQGGIAQVPSMSPDGSTVAYESEGGIFVGSVQ